MGGTYRLYEVYLTIYQDCQNGQPEAIAQDNPAFLAVYRLHTSLSLVAADTSIYYNTALSVRVPANFSNSCVTNVPPTCLDKKVFIKRYAFPMTATGYIVSYQRCCRNSAIMNMNNPGDKGSTYFCTIPPPATTVNNSAVFKNYPPQIICINNPLYYDHSAFDADGDSLTYEFCEALEGASDANIKPLPSAPLSLTSPYYDSVDYSFGYNSRRPMSGFPPIQINPVTGIITGTPNQMGRFLVTVCCHEWRGGVKINTTRREFQFVVTDCSKAVVADIPVLSNSPNTYIVDCQDLTVTFINKSKGGFAYAWDFGVPSSASDVSGDFEPTFTYPDTGTYTVKLVVNPSSTCPDSISRLVKVYPKFRSNFDDTGRLCPGSLISFLDQSSATIKPITYWAWNFGDGGVSADQNPQHTYAQGGTYNVMLISENIKECRDTAVKQVIVQNFKPFAGDDTIIVKGESIRFSAQGGTKYLWSPPDNLDNVEVGNPLGFYPDTGRFTYYLYVESAYGCKGFDTIKVMVVNQASFVVPNAFTPNGDGRNDIFRPMAVGYRELNYFRVFNRWGEEVYFGETLETGWNGTYKGGPAEMSVYYWVISYVDRFGKEGMMKGDVTLLR
jgi:gliding motility-associated-like protein